MNYGDLWWVDLPYLSGREQGGRRPAIIWQDTVHFPANTTVLLLPLTSNQRALRFPGTMVIQPSAVNGLSVASVALVFQLVATDVARVQSQIGQVEAHDLAQLQDLAKRLQRLP